MRSLLLFGLLVWALPFAVAVAISPIKETQRLLFESIMPVAVTIAAVGFGLLYLRRAERCTLASGLITGLIWLAMSWAVDLLMFSTGPMKMSLANYAKDIGITYLIIPLVTVGLAAARANPEPG